MTTAGLGPRGEMRRWDRCLSLRVRLEPRRRADALAVRERAARRACGAAQLRARLWRLQPPLGRGGRERRAGRGARVEGAPLPPRRRGTSARLDRFEGHPFAYERVVKLVLDEHGQRRRATTYLQPEDGFEPWAPQPGYFRVLWRAYARLGFDVAPLASAAGWSHERAQGPAWRAHARLRLRDAPRRRAEPPTPSRAPGSSRRRGPSPHSSCATSARSLARARRRARGGRRGV